MTGGHMSKTEEQLIFRRVTGESVRRQADIDHAPRSAGDFLTARRVTLLEDRTELSQIRVAEGPDRATGYERLDNEILAGRRLYKAAADEDYPAVVSRLYGDTEGGDYLSAGSRRRDESASADPYALLHPYHGQPLQAVVGQMMGDEQKRFEASLLDALCWLEAAGIAHRSLSPCTVYWDSDTRQVQITDFSLSTVFGVPREAIGPRKWVGPEQRSGGKVSGLVTKSDDMHSVGRLIYYVRSLGQEIQDRAQLAEFDLEYLRPLFGAPDQRPTARKLLAGHWSAGIPRPREVGSDSRLEDGRKRFDARRHEKHPEVAGPDRRRDATTGITQAGGDPVSMPAGAVPSPTGPEMSGTQTTRPTEPADRSKRSLWGRSGRS